MKQDERRKLIAKIIGNLRYTKTIPLKSSFTQSDLFGLSSSYKKIATVDVVRDVIDSAVFSFHFMNSVEDKDAGKFTLQHLNDLAEKVDNELKSLPKDYEFIFPMPTSEAPFSETLKLRDENITLYTLGQEEVERYKEKAPGGLVSLLTQQITSLSLTEGQNILKVKVNGAITRDGNIHLPDTTDPLYLYKVINALYIALGGYETVRTEPSWGLRPPLSYSIFDSEYHFIRNFEGDSYDNRLAQKRQFKPLEVSADNELMAATLMIEKVLETNIKDAYLKSQQRRILNGSYWFYEAAKTPHDFARVTYIVTALDALLGEAIDKRRLKAEFIAQSIAFNLKEEKALIESIDKLYILRNNIVHGIAPINTLHSYSSKKDDLFVLIIGGLQTLERFLKKRIEAFCRG